MFQIITVLFFSMISYLYVFRLITTSRYCLNTASITCITKYMWCKYEVWSALYRLEIENIHCLHTLWVTRFTKIISYSDRFSCWRQWWVSNREKKWFFGLFILISQSESMAGICLREKSFSSFISTDFDVEIKGKYLFEREIVFFVSLHQFQPRNQ